MLRIFLFVLVVRLVSAGKEVVVASHFGTAATLDAYAVVLTFCTVPILVVGQSVNAVLLPHFTGDQTAEVADGLFRQSLALAAGAGLALAGVVALGTPILVRRDVLGLSPAAARAAIDMAAPMAAIVPVGIATSVYSCRLMARHVHWNSLWEALPPTAIALTLWLGSGVDGTSQLLWGTVAGYVLYFVATALSQRTSLRNLAPTLRFDWRQLKNAYGGMRLVLSAQIVLYVGSLLDQVFVSHLDQGANASFSYATRLLSLITTLVSIVLGRSIFPVLAEANRSIPGQEFKIAARWILWLAPLGAFAAVIGALVAPPAVALLFQHGAFTAKDTSRVAAALTYGLCQIPFYATATILAYAFAARREYGAGLLANSVALIVKVVATLLLMKGMGLNGVMLAGAGSSAACAAVFAAHLLRRSTEPMSA